MTEILPWVSFCFDFLLSIVLVVVGVTAVRATHATSGYMLAGAGAADLLAACCFRAQEQAMNVIGLTAVTLYSLLGILEKILYFGLIIAAAVTLTNAVLANRAR